MSKGELGGWIESERNLSQDGNCWLSGDAKVFDNASILNNARVSNAEIFGNAVVYGDARVSDAEISDYAGISGNAVVYDAKINGGAKVYDNAEVYGGVEIGGRLEINGDKKIHDKTQFSVIENYKDFIGFYVSEVALKNDAKDFGYSEFEKMAMTGSQYRKDIMNDNGGFSGISQEKFHAQKEACWFIEDLRIEKNIDFALPEPDTIKSKHEKLVAFHDMRSVLEQKLKAKENDNILRDTYREILSEEKALVRSLGKDLVKDAITKKPDKEQPRKAFFSRDRLKKDARRISNKAKQEPQKKNEKKKGDLEL